MAIQDFTKYLGAQVKFTYKPYDSYDDQELANILIHVEGIITEVLLTQTLERCQFVLDDEFYEFYSVTFLDVSLVPEVI